MKSLVIAIAVLLPAMASAAPIVPGKGGDLNCVPWNINMPADAGRYQGQLICEGGLTFKDTNARLYALETAVAELQSQNATLQAQLNLSQAQTGDLAPTATGGGEVADLERRVSALETVTHSIQNSLVFVIQLLTDALNGIKSHA